MDPNTTPKKKKTGTQSLNQFNKKKKPTNALVTMRRIWFVGKGIPYLKP